MEQDQVFFTSRFFAIIVDNERIAEIVVTEKDVTLEAKPVFETDYQHLVSEFIKPLEQDRGERLNIIPSIKAADCLALQITDSIRSCKPSHRTEVRHMGI